MASRLYPPVINHVMPAFDATARSVKIYFAMPIYNAAESPGSVHVTVRYLSNNENALRQGYSARIKVTRFELDSSRLDQADNYYIELPASDLAEGSFISGAIYKIQLRFDKAAYNSNATYGAQYFNTNFANFSEWSTVCLLKPIQVPTCVIQGLDSSDSANVTFLSEDAVFTIVYNAGEDKELLKSWRVKLYNADQTVLLADSGENSYNNYTYLAPSENGSVILTSALPYKLIAETRYALVLDIISQNGYTIHEVFPFTAASIAGEVFQGKVDVIIDENCGYAIININGDIRVEGYNLVLRRASSESGFLIWEDLAFNTFSAEVPQWTFIDRTIESGVWYKYGVQTQDVKGHRGSLTDTNTSNPVMGEWEDVFLVAANGQQLKLKYDFQISSANVTIGESKTDTIGSRYPFIRRNGAMYYRTFQCSGLITGFMDNNERLFIQPEELFYNTSIMNNYYKTPRHQIQEHVNQYDYTYEREFREKVIEFLYDDKVKLFKSLQEGNILVKLMNISLTPKNELGRLLYNFSAQAVEIGEPTLSVLNNYGIQTIGTAQSKIEFSETQIGQISGFVKNNFEKSESDEYFKPAEAQFNTIKAGTNIIHLIGQQCGWVYDSNGTVIKKNPVNNIVIDNFNLTNLKIEFEDEPYLIERRNGELYPFNGTDSTSVDLITGWLLKINGQTILVQLPNRFYEINEPGFVLNDSSSVVPLADTRMNIIFSFAQSKSFNNAAIPNSTTLYNLIGQIQKTFNSGEENNVVTTLQRRYTYNKNESERYLFKGLTLIDIEAEPGAIVYLKTADSNNSRVIMEEATPFVINETGVLRFDAQLPDIIIDKLYFYGMQIDSRYMKNFEEHHKDSQPETPVLYDYYSKDGQLVMYYNRAWYPCEEVQDGIFNIACPVPALINYCVKQEKDVYNS